MNLKFDELSALGAGEFKHLHRSLIEHLNGTYQLLDTWGASQELCDSGLYHAAYGTDGFNTQVVTLSQRKVIANIIGQAAEKIVYLYCSCDRSYVFNNFDGKSAIKFRDRFTQTEFELTVEQAQQFCELTVANELELAMSSLEFKKEHGQSLFNLFMKMKLLLSKPANQMVTRVLDSLA